MKPANSVWSVATPFLFAIAAGTTNTAIAADRLPVKVFILAGQSNMQGHGHVRTIDWLGKDPKHGQLLAKLKQDDGQPVVRDDVWIHYQRDDRTLKAGNLTTGFGARDEKIGPELMFGSMMGDHFDNQVLLIKTAWGGKSLADDFRPPSSDGETGPYYTRMIEIVQSALENLGEHFPDYNDRGYELSGLVWFQGWNDMVKAERVAVYEANMLNFIADVRRDLNTPDLPVVIGELGVGGQESAEKNERMANIRKAQAAPSLHPDFKDTVGFVATSKYWDHEAHEFLNAHWIKRKWDSEENKQKFEIMGSQPPYHYLGSAKIYSLIGYGFAEEMKRLRADAR